MTIENEWFPACFFNRLQYRDWKYYQRGSSERCTACDDCSSEYMFKMIDQQRCYPEEVIKRTSNSIKRVKK